MKEIKKGDKLICTWEDTYHLTEGKEYIALTDQEPGIFAPWPYIRVTSDLTGESFGCYANRFKKT